LRQVCIRGCFGGDDDEVDDSNGFRVRGGEGNALYCIASALDATNPFLI
jgi:hypothetical protein